MMAGRGAPVSLDRYRRLLRRSRRGEVRSPGAYVALAVIGLLLVGIVLLIYFAQGEELETRYGTASAPYGTVSVNGAGILAGLFRDAGHRVSSWPRLSPGLWERADTIVWFPNDLQCPSDEVVDWLEEWLMDETGRTLIFVGRDFDAAPGYWNKVSPGAPPHLASHFALKQSEAATKFMALRQVLITSEDWHWFTMKGTLKHRHVTTLEGSPNWLQGVDASKSEIELNGRLVPPEDRQERGIDILLESEGDALAWREDYFGSQLIVIANGSFLLNFQLINHEHRKLAAALVREVGPPGHVVFVEASGIPEVLDEDPKPRMPTAGQLLGISPFNKILLHLALAGIIFCLARWPIFGRPREEPPAPLSDFGEHVSSLGELLALTGNRELAQARLQHYLQLQRTGIREPRRHEPPPPANPTNA